MKIGIFGGTFDPIHQGHLALARAAQKQFGLQKILFVPALIPPHKSSRRDLTPAPYRYRMVEIAIRNEPNFEISDVEFNRPEVSYTVETLRDLKKKYPDDELFLIVGADSLAEMHKWREPDEIQRLAGVLVARRSGVDIAAASQIPSQGGVEWPVQWIEMKDCPLSSSQIREMFFRAEALSGDILPEGVEDYILKMKLYEKAKPCTSS